MKTINEAKLTAICAEEATKPDFPAEEFSELFQDIGEAANSTVSACMLAIALFTQVKKALMFKFSGSRVAIQQESVNRAYIRYLSE